MIPDALFHTDDVKQALIGLMRDLRGIAMATSRLVAWSILIFSVEGQDLNILHTNFSFVLFLPFNSRRTYSFLFDWLYPAHIPLLLKAITIWADTPEVRLNTQLDILLW